MAAAPKKVKNPRRTNLAPLAADASPDKPTIVGAAVANQLHHEGRWPPNDVTRIMSTDYHYNQMTLANFLTAVQWNLLHGSPPYNFAFDGAFVLQVLPLSVGALMVAVSSRTQ